MEYPKLVPNVEICESIADVIVYDKNREKIHVVNASAGAILAWCTGETATSEIATHFAGAYGITPARAQHDVSAALATFVEMGLVLNTATRPLSS